jgi:hypothetical protein
VAVEVRSCRQNGSLENHSDSDFCIARCAADFCVEIFRRKRARYARGEPFNAHGTQTEWQLIDPRVKNELDKAN